MQFIILATATLVSSAQRTVLERAIKCSVTFYPYHITKLQLSKKSISTHTQLKFQILPWSKSSFSVLCCFSPYRSVEKGNQEMLQSKTHIGTYCVVQTLYFFLQYPTRPSYHLWITLAQTRSPFPSPLQWPRISRTMKRKKNNK